MPSRQCLWTVSYFAVDCCRVAHLACCPLFGAYARKSSLIADSLLYIEHPWCQNCEGATEMALRWICRPYCVRNEWVGDNKLTSSEQTCPICDGRSYCQLWSIWLSLTLFQCMLICWSQSFVYWPWQSMGQLSELQLLPKVLFTFPFLVTDHILCLMICVSGNVNTWTCQWCIRV